MTELAAAPAEAVEPYPKVDPTRNQILLFVGRKGSGKSAAAREYFRDWGGADRFVIDPTGDADPGSPRQAWQPSRYADDLGTVRLNQLPASLPERPMHDGKRVPGVWRWVANPASPTYADDLDRAVGLSLFPKGRRTVTWIDEAADVFPSSGMGPHARTALAQSRHWHASYLICCPRPMTISPLVLQQADRVLMFDVPGVADRQRLAETLGWPLKVAGGNVAPGNDLTSLLNEVRRLPFHYLMFDAASYKMYLCPPLPQT